MFYLIDFKCGSKLENPIVIALAEWPVQAGVIYKFDANELYLNITRKTNIKLLQLSS